MKVPDTAIQTAAESTFGANLSGFLLSELKLIIFMWVPANV